MQRENLNTNLVTLTSPTLEFIDINLVRHKEAAIVGGDVIKCLQLKRFEDSLLVDLYLKEEVV